MYYKNQHQLLLDHLCQAANLEIGSEAERTVFFFVVCMINLGTIFMLSLSCMCFIWNCPKGIYIYESVWDSGSPFFVFVLGMLSKFIWIFKCVANRKSIALNTRRMNSQHLRCLCHMHQNMQRFWDLFVSGSLSFQHFIHKFHLIQDLGRFFMACKDESCWICTKNNKILPKIVVIQPPQATISSHKDVAV